MKPSIGRRPFHFWPLLILLGTGLTYAGPAAAATAYNADFTVNSSGDIHDAIPDGVCETAPGNGDCTLRAAFDEADLRVGLLTFIAISPQIQVIQLSLGDIVVEQSVTLQGNGPTATRIEPLPGSPNARFLRQHAAPLNAGQLNLRDLTIAGFHSSGGGGAIATISSRGGGLSIEGCNFSSNHTSGGGGAIYWSEGNNFLDIRRTTFAYNSSANGGSIFATAFFVTSGYLISDSTFEGESASGAGGALYLLGEGRIERSYFAGNQAALGGAIYMSHGPLDLVNVTLTGNRALGDGGAIYKEEGELGIFNSTIAGNVANSDQLIDGGAGGGLFNYQAELPVLLFNSILAGNWEWGSDPYCCFQNYVECHGTIRSNDFNILQGNDGSCIVGGTVAALDPLLLPAAWNGGLTRTRALPSGSPAVSAGNPSGCVDNLGAPITTDQRGALRPFAGICDLGAFEFGALIFDDGFEPGGTWRWSLVAP